MPVYLIRCGDAGPVKIGWAVDPVERLGELQCAHHETLTIIRLWDGGRSEEAWLHRNFRHAKIRNEWFRFDPSMLSVEPPPGIPIESGPTKPITEAFGGQRALARALGINPDLACHWNERGIPAKHWHEVEELARKLGIEITARLLKAIPHRPQRAAR